MKRLILPLLLTLTFILAACAPAQATPLQTDPQPASVSTEATSPSSESATRTDQQGAAGGGADGAGQEAAHACNEYVPRSLLRLAIGRNRAKV